MVKAKIPQGITQEDFMEIGRCLRNILGQTHAMLVNMRLNKTGIKDPAPVFVGWVEHDELKKIRLDKNESDPGLYRFGDTVGSKTYTETLLAKGAIKERDWSVSLTEKHAEQKALAPKAGVMYQKLIGIIVEEGSVRRCVGTLNLGFYRKPDAQVVHNAERIMKDWAQNPGSQLVKFLKANFEFGGPAFKK